MSSDTPTTLTDFNDAKSAMVIIWCLSLLSTFIVALRCYTQVRFNRAITGSDGLVVVATVTTLGMAIVLSVSYHYGWGRHKEFLSAYGKKIATEWILIAGAFGIMSATFGRMSFIMFMVKLFGNSRTRRWSLWGLFGVQFVWNIIGMTLLYAQCEDVRTLWDPTVISKCMNPVITADFGYSQTGLNAATDLFLTCLPATMLWNLQMNLRTKVGLIILLGLSSIAFVSVIVKLLKVSSLTSPDLLFANVEFLLWAASESNLVIIAASIPILRPLFTHFQSARAASRHAKVYANSYELHNQNGINASGRGFTKIQGNGNRSATKASDAESEEGILPMQAATGLVIKTQTTYTVEVVNAVDAADADLEKGSDTDDPKYDTRLRNPSED